MAVQADLTVTFIALKLGLFTGAGPDRVGELQFADLQADAALLAQRLRPPPQRLAAANLPRLAGRPRTAHKGLFGRVLVVGGDRGFGGAALLAAQAALRGGAGSGVPGDPWTSMWRRALARLPELMVRGSPRPISCWRWAGNADVLVVGAWVWVCRPGGAAC